MRHLLRAAGATASALAVASCGLVGGGSSEAPGPACAALVGASAAVASVSSAKPQTTAGDLQNELTAISTKLEEARTSDPAAAGALDRLQRVVAAAQGQVAAVDPETLLRTLTKLDARRAQVKTVYQQTLTGMQCR